ncbi:MAG: hypothetical protein FWG57_08710 [Endomicrobia bacterium]|nr:hypothetical protein [Endomicrobiia bacterium]
MDCRRNKILKGSERMLTLRIKRGAAFNIGLQLVDKEPDAAGNAVVLPLEPYFNARMQIRDSVNNALLADLSEANQKIIIDKVNNIISITIPPSDTAFEAFGQLQGVYDLFLDFTDSENNTQTISPIFGTVVLFEEITDMSKITKTAKNDDIAVKVLTPLALVSIQGMPEAPDDDNIYGGQGASWIAIYSKEDINGFVSDLSSRIDSILGKITYLPAHDFGASAPSQSDLTNYALGIRPDLINSLAVKNLFDNVEWIYNEESELWINNGTAAVAVATNNSLGIVKGNAANLYVAVNPDGSMQVQGLEQALGGKVSKAGDTMAGNLLINKPDGLFQIEGGWITPLGGNFSSYTWLYNTQVGVSADNDGVNYSFQDIRMMLGNVDGYLNPSILLQNTSGANNGKTRITQFADGKIQFADDSNPPGTSGNFQLMVQKTSNGTTSIAEVVTEADLGQYLTAEEVYNSFSSVYYEPSGAPSGTTKNIASIIVGDNLTNAVADVSQYEVGKVFSGTIGTSIKSAQRIIKGTPNSAGDYLELDIFASTISGQSEIRLNLNQRASGGTLIAQVNILLANIVLVSDVNPKSVQITAILNKNLTQLLSLGGIDFGLVTSITIPLIGFPSLAFTDANVILNPTPPYVLVNLPSLRKQVGFTATATFILGAAGVYSSSIPWLFEGFTSIRELRAVIKQGNQVKGISPEKLSFDTSAKTLTITTDTDLTGWTAKVTAVYDIE